MWVWFLLASALAAQTTPGVIGSFSDGRTSVRFAAAHPNFHLDAAESIHPALAPSFQGEWRGMLQILANGSYEFSHALTIAGKAAKTHSLSAGSHSFQVPYSRPAGTASLRLLWRGANFDWEPVPPSAFTRDTAVEPLAPAGLLHIQKAGCANCHPSSLPVDRTAPRLNEIGSRVNPAWLYPWLRKHQYLPHTPQQSADLAAYLASRKGPVPKARRANEVAVGKGGEIFGTYGCVNCHGATIAGLGSKSSLNSLTQYLLAQHEPSMLLNDEDATAIAAHLVRSTDFAREGAAPAGDAARGQQALETLGCLGCHEQRRAAKPLAALRSADCPQVKPGWDSAKRSQVQTYLAQPAPRAPAPLLDAALQIERHQCGACHKPGTEAPPLEGAGEKLKTNWIEAVLSGKKRIRHGRELRMPHYAPDTVRGLAAALAKAEGVAPGDGATPPDFPQETRLTGVGMLGTNSAKKGMACIGCHDWGNYRALGEEGPQLINAAERMRFDWYERWMRNPARILSGTSMPNYFGAMPRDRALPLIHTLWAGMELGAKAPVPDGYRVSDLESSREAKPVPDKEAIVVRWDMPEATPAAIAVGLPGGLSYCFDAGESRLRYAWKGGFLDMTGTLLRKVDEKKLTPTAALVGEVFWRSKEFPLQLGAEKRIPQRRFRGYRLIDGIPEFRYDADGIEVREKLVNQGGALLRQVRFSRVDGPAFWEGREVPNGVDVTVEMRLNP